MSSTYIGNHIRLTVFGQSHSEAVGMTLDGLPAGIAVDPEALQAFLKRRAPGRNDWSTARREADEPEFLCGLKDGRTCGAPLTAIIRNNNTRSQDYDELRFLPRPGHADYTARLRHHGYEDFAGGHSSALHQRRYPAAGVVPPRHHGHGPHHPDRRDL